MSNPYASYLGEREPLPVIETTYERLTALLAGLTEEQLARPTAPGKWSLHQIVAHLADVELVFSARLRWVAFEAEPLLAGFDQEVWTNGWNREQEPFGETLDRFRVLRASTVRLLRHMPDADWQRMGKHTERGLMSLRQFAEYLAGHDLNHLTRLEEMRQSW